MAVVPSIQRVVIPAGTTDAGTAPFKFTSGTNRTTPVDGEWDFGGNHVCVTLNGVVTQLDNQTGNIWRAWAFSEDQQTTTAATYQTALDLTRTVVAGDYGFQWYFEHKGSSEANHSLAYFALDDAAKTSELEAYTTFLGVGGSLTATLTAASHSLKIKYCNATAGETSYILRCRLIWWRL